MPIIYLPQYIRDIDYKVLIILDKKGGKSKISSIFIEEVNINPYHLEKSLKRLQIELLVRLRYDAGVIIEVELTERALTILSEHILINNKVKGC